MRAKSMLLILIALGCGLVASIAISQVMERGPNPPMPVWRWCRSTWPPPTSTSTSN